MADLGGERGLTGDLLPEQAGPVVAAGSERRREFDQVADVQHAQGLEAGGALGGASRRAEAKLATDDVGRRRAMRGSLVGHEGREPLEALRTGQSGEHATLYRHPSITDFHFRY